MNKDQNSEIAQNNEAALVEEPLTIEVPTEIQAGFSSDGCAPGCPAEAS